MRNYRRRKAAGGKENGSFWLCYSDLMSSLLLVFILIMFYSVYQYFDMLEVKTAELLRQSGLLDAQSAELTDKSKELDEKDAQLNASQDKLTESETTLLAEQAKLLLYEKQLENSSQLLAQQKEQLAAAQALLGDKEAQLADQQNLLSQQQTLMDQQQSQLDALVGVRARIIASLAEALKEANISATVDPKSGAITLDSNVLFDLNSSTVKQTGRSFLDKFVPIYLNVLFSEENFRYVSEVIIEGHTDTVGSYMANLELSQRRALSVAQYLLSEDYASISADMKTKLRAIVTANGRSYSNPILDANGNVDMAASRRVEFKFRLTDEEMIEQMRVLLGNMQ